LRVSQPSFPDKWDTHHKTVKDFLIYHAKSLFASTFRNFSAKNANSDKNNGPHVAADANIRLCKLKTIAVKEIYVAYMTNFCIEFRGFSFILSCRGVGLPWRRQDSMCKEVI
jgi:hypothetical protein